MWDWDHTFEKKCSFCADVCNSQDRWNEYSIEVPLSMQFQWHLIIQCEPFSLRDVRSVIVSLMIDLFSKAWIFFVQKWIWQCQTRIDSPRLHWSMSPNFRDIFRQAHTNPIYLSFKIRSSDSFRSLYPRRCRWIQTSSLECVSLLLLLRLSGRCILHWVSSSRACSFPQQELRRCS